MAGLLVAAFALRVSLILLLPAHTWFDGGDGPWYVRQAWLMCHGLVHPLETVGPLFPLTLAALWRLFPGHPDPVSPDAVAPAFLTTVRLLQALLGTAAVGATYWLGRRLVEDRRAALVAAIGVALSPAFVIEPFMIRTESLCIVLLTASVASQSHRMSKGPLVESFVAGGLAGFAALTRPILLLFPVVLAAHVLVRDGRRDGARRAAAVIVAAVLVLTPWHVWLHQRTGHWLPGGFGFNLLAGAQANGQALDRPGFDAAERQIQTSGRSAVGEAVHVIAADPVRWTWLRVRNVGLAVLQPHGTSDLAGPPVKASLAAWWHGSRSPVALVRIVFTWGFVVRATIYAFHYAALALALVGLNTTRRVWRRWAAVDGATAYLVVAYGLLVVSPRYLFPIQPFLWVLAGAGFLVLARAPARQAQVAG